MLCTLFSLYKLLILRNVDNKQIVITANIGTYSIPTASTHT